jgi:hypothetical protein
MKGVAIFGMLLFFAVVLFLAGTFFIENAQCVQMQREFPEYSWRLNLLTCQTILDGRWIDAELFREIGTSP